MKAKKQKNIAFQLSKTIHCIALFTVYRKELQFYIVRYDHAYNEFKWKWWNEAIVVIVNYCCQKHCISHQMSSIILLLAKKPNEFYYYFNNFWMCLFILMLIHFHTREKLLEIANSVSVSASLNDSPPDGLNGTDGQNVYKIEIILE